jgi:hypothetical protein
MQTSNCLTLVSRSYRRRMISLLRLALDSKNASVAGQAPCSRRTRSNPETIPATLMTIELQSKRRHLTFRMRINRPPRHRFSAYLCQRHRLAGRNDWRARLSQPFAGYRTHDQGRVQRRQPTARWQDKSREVRGGRLAGKRAMINDLAQCVPAHDSLPIRTSHCKYRQERTSRSGT